MKAENYRLQDPISTHLYSQSTSSSLLFQNLLYAGNKSNWQCGNTDGWNRNRQHR